MTGTFQIVLLFVAIPFHGLLIKILAMDFQFNLPRHIILFSLSLSDAVLVVGLFISAFVNKVIKVTMHSTGCTVYRGFTIFIACSTLVISSTSIVALSLERYIACIHSFRLHQILIESRVRCFSIFLWLLGVFVGFLAVSATRYDDPAIIPNPSVFHYIYLVFDIPPLVVVTIIQVRLFIFSRKKINRINPAGAFGAALELADYRKKHLKVAFMASIVAFAFLICTIPLAVLFLYELVSGESISFLYRSVCLSLSFSNSLVDPFIYGLGIADTRRMVIRSLKELKEFLNDMLPENDPIKET